MQRVSFRIVADCGMPLQEQIKNQIISSLYTGKIQEGDPLPSVRELAELAGVNPKTILKIYRALQAEGYVQMVRGKGVFVRKLADEDFTQRRRGAIMNLIKTTLEKSHLLGVPHEQFAHLLLRYTTGAGLHPLRCAVVDDAEEIEVFTAELQRRLDIAIHPVLLENLERELTPANAAIRTVPYVLTTSWHIAAVRPLAAALGKRLLEIKINPGVFGEIAQVMRERNVGVVVRDMRTLHTSFDVFAKIFRPATDKQFLIAPADNAELLERIARESDIVFTSPLCWEAVRRITPAGVELRTFQDFISGEFIDTLRVLQLFEDTASGEAP